MPGIILAGFHFDWEDLSVMFNNKIHLSHLLAIVVV